MPIEVIFRNEPSDHHAAHRLYYRHTLWWEVDKAVAVLLLVLGTVSVFDVGPRWWTLIWFPLAVAEWFSLFSLHRVRIFLLFKRDPKLSETYRLSFSDDGITFNTESIDSRIDWSFYRRVMEDHQVVLLVYGRWMYTVIPRRAFTDASEFERFRSLVHEKVTDSRLSSPAADD